LAGLVIATALIVATAPRLRFAHPTNGLVFWLQAGALVLGGLTTVAIFVQLVRAASERAAERARAESVRREKELARAFHESLAQDLAFIVTYTSTVIARGEGPELLDEVLAAGRRSLDEVRCAIAILSGERANTASSIEANERVPVLDASATYVREHV
jgi:hypothetical protein